MNDIVVKTDKFDINNKNLVIGKQGENIARQIVFDFSAWHEKFGEGTLTLFVKRHGEDASYPVIPVIEQTTARWSISATDTAIYGSGSAELRYVVNNVVVKSETFPTFVYRSITETTAPAPDPYESWVETLVALGDKTRIYAERAEAAASSAKDHAESAQAAAESAESYSSHPPMIGEDGNWELWNGTAYVSSAYPSRGEQGPAGSDAAVTAANIKAAGGLVAPETMSVGQFFRIASFDEGGHAVIEAVDAPSSETADHRELSNRDAPYQHPITAIAGLEAALDGKQDNNIGKASAGQFLVVGDDGIITTRVMPTYDGEVLPTYNGEVI